MRNSCLYYYRYKIITFLLIPFFAIMLSNSAVAQMSLNKKCAVLDFIVDEDVTAEEGQYITNTFRKYFNPAGYTMLDRSYINESLREAGCINNSIYYVGDNMVKAGIVLGVPYIIAGHVTKFGDTYIINVEILEVNNNKPYEDWRWGHYNDLVDVLSASSIKTFGDNAMRILTSGAMFKMSNDKPKVFEDYALDYALDIGSAPNSDIQNNNGDIVSMYDNTGKWICNGLFIKSSDRLAVRISGKKYTLEKSNKSDFRYKTVPKQNNERSLYVK